MTVVRQKIGYAIRADLYEGMVLNWPRITAKSNPEYSR